MNEIERLKDALVMQGIPYEGIDWAAFNSNAVDWYSIDLYEPSDLDRALLDGGVMP